VTVAPLAGLTSEGADGVGRAGAVTVSVAVRVTPANTAETIAEVGAVTVFVVIVAVPLVAPAGTMMLGGVVTVDELSESDTTAPPLGAAALSVTRAVDEVPPTTVEGLTVTDESVAAGATPVVFLNATTPALAPP